MFNAMPRASLSPASSLFTSRRVGVDSDVSLTSVVDNHHRRARVVGRRARHVARASEVDIDAGKYMLEREDYLFVDCRSWKEYDRSHITKPPAKTINVPLAQDASVEDWVKAAREKTRPAMKLLIVDADGARVAELVSGLEAAGYTNAVPVAGGYAAWTAKYTTFGRKVPPKGKFVSTGKEALKSGLDLDPNVASAYEENWGRAPPKYGEEAKSD